jgi:predicted metal-dependent phosphoesterase TrpH
MLVTDHNSYKGYEKWKEISNHITLSKPFVVLKGVEYDTSDGGHILVILPDHIHSRLLEKRGMKTAELVELVHRLGGILGPAHPYGNGFFAHMHTKAARVSLKSKKDLDHFDFIETFNSCMPPLSNEQSRLLAIKYKKPAFAGSDAHRPDAIGSAFTIFEEDIFCNNDLIRAVKNHHRTIVSREPIPGVFHNQHWPLKQFLIWGYYFYNKIGFLQHLPLHRKHSRYINIVTPSRRKKRG